MSSNLLKKGFTNLVQSDARVISVNDLMEKRLQELSLRSNGSQTDGFVSGLTADIIESSALAEEAGEESGNIIKAGPDAETVRAQAQREAEELLADARAHAAEIEQMAAAQAQQEKEQVLEQARQQGYAEGLEKAQREAAKLETEYDQKIKSLETEYQKLSDELEPQFVEVITGIYEQIFQVELSSHKEILCHLITSTMRRTEGNHDFLVHVSREDYPYVTEQKSQLVEGVLSPNSTMEIVEDMTLGENECLIETDGGIFDCGLGTQLTELRKRLTLLSYEK